MSAKKEARKKMMGQMKKMKSSNYEDKMSPMRRVTVASDSKKGLEKGLSMAEKLMKSRSDYKQGGMKYKDGGKGDKGRLSDSDIERYKLPKSIVEARDKVLETAKGGELKGAEVNEVSGLDKMKKMRAKYNKEMKGKK